jgi:hypothetical protein
VAASLGTIITALRPGRIRRPRSNNGISTCFVEFLDRAPGEAQVEIDSPQPMAVSGTGIFVDPPDGALVLVGRGLMNRMHVVCYLNDQILDASTRGPSLFNSISTSYFPRPEAEPGEVVIKGGRTTYSKYSLDGEILDRFGKTSSISLSPSDAIGTYADGAYTSYTSGYSVNGVVRREAVAQLSLRSGDRLASPGFDDFLDQVGRDPTLSIVKLTEEGSGRRNPPFVEQRNVVYEFSRDFAAADPAKEELLYAGTSPRASFSDIKTERQGSRTDAFGLGPLQYNLLSESLIGTAVDIYGNILDLNRNVIPAEEMQPNDETNRVKAQYRALRRSLKLHMELNSRKDAGSASKDSTEGPFPNSPEIIADHSRWSVDVDGEGQTKINIPASSPTGNIPVHARYLTSSYLIESNDNLSITDYAIRNSGSTSNDRNQETELGPKRDILHLNYSSVSQENGLPIQGSYAPQSLNVRRGASGQRDFRWTMPYHDPGFRDILSLPTTIGVSSQWYLDGYASRSPRVTYRDIFKSDVLSATSLSNAGDGANAGGRSLSINADGSLELSVGLDQADGKSIVLDTAGSLIGRLGKDRLNNSVMLAGDGNATLVFGASGKTTDNRKTQPSNFKIFVHSDSGPASIEVINGNIYIRSAPEKNLVFEAAKNVIINAGDTVLINGERMGLFGKYSADGKVVQRKRVVERDGKKI